MPGISTMAPCSLDDVRESPNHLFDLRFRRGSTEGKSHAFARLIGRHAEADQHGGRLDRAARTGRTGGYRDARKIERHHDRFAERTAPCRVDRATHACAIVAMDACTERA